MRSALRLCTAFLVSVSLAMILSACATDRPDAERQATNAAPQTNLLFIIADQLQYRALSNAGNTVVETPNLDRFGQPKGPAL